MFYKIKNIFFLSVFSLGITLCYSSKLMALVTLSEDAIEEENNELNKDVPDEFAMFAEEEVSDPALIPFERKEEKTIDKAPVAPKVIPKTGIIQPKIENDDIFMPKKIAEKETETNFLGLGDDVENDDLFSKMSDLEKQTALLNIELRREKVKNEIEAIKSQRKQAIIQEREKAEAQEKQKIEWEKNQEQKVLLEQQKLRELDISFENLRQEKILNAYKSKYLEDVQGWISHDAELYKEMEGLRKESASIAEDSKNKFIKLKKDVIVANNNLDKMTKNHKHEINELNSQIGVLKSRIITQEKELESFRENPFETAAGGDTQSVNSETMVAENNLSDLYAVMEIRGQGGELIAKLINKDGTPFYVKNGTSLQSGHNIDEITSTYVRAEKNGVRDYLYFAAGGILPSEQPASAIKPRMAGATEEAMPGEDTHGFATSDEIPGVGSSMMAR